MKYDRFPVSGFRGLNTVEDPMRLDLSWLKTVDNCVIRPDGQLRRTDGYVSKATGTKIVVYTTEDFKHMFVVDNGTLYEKMPDWTNVTLATGLSTLPMRFVEVNGLVFYTNGVDYGVIQGQESFPWGIATPNPPNLSAGSGSLQAGTYQACCTLTARGLESGASAVAEITVPDDSSIAVHDIPQVSGYTTNVYVTPCDSKSKTFGLLAERAGTAVTYNCSPDALGEELLFWNAGPPRGSIPALFGSQIWIAEHFPAQDQTVIWPSMPTFYHHFELSGSGEDFPGAITVSGEVLLMHGVDEGLLIGTDRNVMLWNTERNVELADYGVVPGRHFSKFKGKIFFWTLRGMARAMPFENVTENTISVPPGVRAGAMVVEKNGYARFVVAIQKGGSAYNTMR